MGHNKARDNVRARRRRRRREERRLSPLLPPLPHPHDLCALYADLQIITSPLLHLVLSECFGECEQGLTLTDAQNVSLRRDALGILDLVELHRDTLQTFAIAVQGYPESWEQVAYESYQLRYEKRPDATGWHVDLWIQDFAFEPPMQSIGIRLLMEHRSLTGYEIFHLGCSLGAATFLLGHLKEVPLPASA